jgi:hypothetical protein
MQTFEFRKSDHHRPSDRDVNDGNKDRELRAPAGGKCRPDRMFQNAAELLVSRGHNL